MEMPITEESADIAVLEGITCKRSLPYAMHITANENPDDPSF